MKDVAKFWAEHFVMQENSGMSVSEYCRSKKLKTSTWYNAKSRYKDATGSQKFSQIIIKDRPAAKELSVSIAIFDDGKIEFNGTTTDIGFLPFSLARVAI